MTYELFEVFGISLGLGLLIGLQRQYDESELAGIRTFPIITLFGTLSGILAQELGGWVIAAGFLSVTALTVTGNILKSKQPPFSIGLTTEAAMLLMYAVGTYLVLGNRSVAVTLGATVAVLLQLKSPLHRIISKIGEKDLKAIMQFVVVSLVILPVLPDERYGPYDALNPHNIWLMVVLIVGISLLGYFAYKIFGQKAGTILGGVLGGLISSTATTVTYARRAKNAGTSTTLAAIVIFIASAVAIVRVIAEVAVVAPSTLATVAPPLAALLFLMVLIGAVAYFFKKEGHDKIPEQKNPAQLKTALIFGAVYAAVVLATAFARDEFGEEGIYGVAIISGLTDLNAITLSTARLMSTGSLKMSYGWRAILIAALSNLVFKGVLVGILGNKSVFGKVGILFGLVLAGGLLVLWLWPSDFQLFTDLIAAGE